MKQDENDQNYKKESMLVVGRKPNGKSRNKSPNHRNKPMKTEFKTFIHAVRHSFGGAVCAGAILLITPAAQAQNLFVSDSGSGSIYEFTTNGTQSTFATGLDGPTGLAFDRAGDLYEADNGSGTIIEFTNGVAAEQGTFATGLVPNGLAFDSAGDLFGVNEDYGIIEFTNGVATEQGTFATGVGNPYLVAFDSAGDLFVASQGNQYVIEITPGGVRSNIGSPSANYPSGLAVDSAGDLFVSENHSGSICEFVNNGGTLNSTPITVASGLDSPAGLAFDSAGDLFEADSGSGNIYEFTNNAGTLSSTAVTFVSGLIVPVELAFAPKPPFSVSIKMFAGIILNNGNIGSNYLIQATGNLSSSNWTTLTNVTLPSNPYIYIDYSSYTNSQQFYRVQPQ